MSSPVLLVALFSPVGLMYDTFVESRAFPGLVRFTISSAEHPMKDEQCLSLPLIIRFQSEGQSNLFHFLFGKDVVPGMAIGLDRTSQ